MSAASISQEYATSSSWMETKMHKNITIRTPLSQSKDSVSPVSCIWQWLIPVPRRKRRRKTTGTKWPLPTTYFLQSCLGGKPSWDRESQQSWTVLYLIPLLNRLCLAIYKANSSFNSEWQKKIDTGLNFLTFCLKMSGVRGQPLWFMSIHFLIHFTTRIRNPKIIAQMETYRALPPKEGSSHVMSSSSGFVSGSLLHLREFKIIWSTVTLANSLCHPYTTDKMAKLQYLVLSNDESSAASSSIWTHSFISLTSHLCYRKSWSESKWKHAER